MLLIIDDASHDGTGRVADELASRHPWIEVIHHEQNRGYGGAQKTGLLEGLRRGARGFAIVHADEHCVKHRKRIVQFSTCEVYGRTVAGVLGKDPGEMPFPFHEDTSPLIMGPVKNHRWIYACAKQLLERVLHAHGLEDGLNYTIIRPFNFIGPRIDYLPSEKAGNPRVFSHFMNALLYGTPMKLVDGGRSYRAYTHIDDAVEGIVRILDNPGGVCDREIFNLGTPENETTIRGLALRMRGIFDEHFRRPGDPDPGMIEVSGEEFYGKGYEDCDRRIPDVTKARTLLGWESRHDLDSVIYHTMKYFVDAHRAKTEAR